MALDAEPTPQRLVEDLDRSANERPAALADLLVRAAGTDLIVVGHIDIEDELAALRLERAGRERLAVAGLRA
jgi:hypothetical protein